MINREARLSFTDVSTLEDFIASASSDKISYSSLSILAKANSLYYPAHNIIYDYLDNIESKAVVIDMTDIQYERYKFRPDLLAYDIYKNTELEFIILALNKIQSPKEFTRKKIKMLASEQMLDLINTIYNSEKASIDKNRSQLNL